MSHRRNPHVWQGRLTGSCPLWGSGEIRGHLWYFRADLTGWSFQATLPRPGNGTLLGGAGNCVDDGSSGWGSTPCHPTWTDVDAAWRLIETCLAAHQADQLTELGPDSPSPVSLLRYPRQPPDPLPAAAVPGDPSRQPDGQWLPREFYMDDHRICRQCGDRFVFSAREQRRWYEELRFNLESVAVRCRRCRRERRRQASHHRRLQTAIAALDRRPRDATVHLRLAAAIVELRSANGRVVNLDRAIHAARTALALRPDLSAAHYWEARAHELAGRPGRAIDGYLLFLAQSTEDDGGERFRQEAILRLGFLERGLSTGTLEGLADAVREPGRPSVHCPPCVLWLPGVPSTTPGGSPPTSRWLLGC